jgi:hypothetical protein
MTIQKKRKHNIYIITFIGLELSHAGAAGAKNNYISLSPPSYTTKKMDKQNFFKKKTDFYSLKVHTIYNLIHF